MPIFLDFDFCVLDKDNFNEDAVREEIIWPILSNIGYASKGNLLVKRGLRLEHPFVSIGSKRQGIKIIPDYVLYYNDEPFMVLDAKAPKESVIKSKHVEQVYSYAIHPEIRSDYYALCNGRNLVVYSVRCGEPILYLDVSEIDSRWDEVCQNLHPVKLERSKTEIPARLLEIGTLEEYPFGSIKRVVKRVRVPVGLKRRQLAALLEYEVQELALETGAKAVELLAYREQDKMNNHFTAAKVTYAPNGDWGSVASLDPMQSSLIINSLYFAAPVTLLPAKTIILLKTVNEKTVEISSHFESWIRESIIADVDNDTRAIVLDSRVEALVNMELVRYKVAVIENGVEKIGWVHQRNVTRLR